MTTENADKLRVAFGSVVNVKAIPTRDVTRIEIELPIEFHAELTRLLFGRDALVLPSNLPASVNYGVMDSTEGAGAPQESPQASSPRPSSAFSAAAARPTRPGVQRGVGSLDITRWLGLRCNESSFMAFLQVGSSSEAAQCVREICGVNSRSEIASSPAARSLFYHHVYRPYQHFLAAQSTQAHGSKA